MGSGSFGRANMYYFCLTFTVFGDKLNTLIFNVHSVNFFNHEIHRLRGQGVEALKEAWGGGIIAM